MTPNSRSIPVAAVASEGDIFYVSPGPFRIMKLAEGQNDPQVLAEVEKPTALTADATHVYFADAARRTVCRVARSGGEICVLASCEDAPDFVVLIEDQVYWVTCKGAIYAVDKNGGCPERACSGRELP